LANATEVVFAALLALLEKDTAAGPVADQV
jgi:hypothetical protein